MSCKYNNSLYAEPPEINVEFDAFEQLLLSEDYETQEELNNRLNEEYNEFQVYELSVDEMLDLPKKATNTMEVNNYVYSWVLERFKQGGKCTL